MRSSIYARWVRAHKLQAYLVIPGAVAAVLILAYFSGSNLLQSLVAPSFYGVDIISAGKVGALELLQLALLAGVLFFGLRCFFGSEDMVARLVLLVLLGAIVFVTVQEIDYGSHYREVLNRPPAPVRVSSWDPIAQPEAPPEAEQVASRFTGMVCALVLLAYLLLPMIPLGRNRTLRLLVPSPWLSAGAVFTALMYWIAWHLDSNGHSIIEGRAGWLSYDLYEFLQLGVYYYLLLTLAELHERIVARQ